MTALDVTQPRAVAGRLQPYLERPEAVSTIFLLALVIALTAVVPGFAAAENLQGIISQIAVTGVVALAVNQVILSGEIDISTGSALGLTAAVAGAVAERTGGVVVPLVCAVLVGVAVGVVNGLLTTWAKVASIIVTLGTMSIIRGGLLDQAGGSVFNPPTNSRALGTGLVPILLLVLVGAAFAMINRHTAWGRNVIAVGGNRRAAELAGVPIARVQLWTFVAVGACVGLGAMIYLGQVGQVQATAGTGFELQVIAAVVVGGTSISGGRGSTIAPIIGATLIGVILNALALLGVAGTWQSFILGVLILLAISAEPLRRRITEARP
jgi:ribose/xylose/arabinose/galactoside ABC-type transport system permease subunit